MTWTAICKFDDIVPDTGVCALVNGKQVAIFRVDDRIFAVGNHDPFSGANVLSRGLVGDRDGVLKVTSPLYKQNFGLATGVCLDDPSVRIPCYDSRVRDGLVEVCVPATTPARRSQAA